MESFKKPRQKWKQVILLWGAEELKTGGLAFCFPAAAHLQTLPHTFIMFLGFSSTNSIYQQELDVLLGHITENRCNVQCL